MSYWRFLEADIYLFWSSSGGIECGACSLGRRKKGAVFPQSQLLGTFKGTPERSWSREVL